MSSTPKDTHGLVKTGHFNLRLVLVTLLFAATGCAYDRHANPPDVNSRWREDLPTEGTGTVSGFVSLPPDLHGPAQLACEALEVQVTRPRETEALGQSSVAWRNGRCTYQVSRLPASGKRLLIHVRPNPDWRCMNGNALSREGGDVVLREHQLKLRDYRLTCSAESPAVAEASPADSRSEVREVSPEPTLPGRAAPAPSPKNDDNTDVFHAGVRAAYALPFGVFTGAADSLYLYNIYLGTVPVWVDAEFTLLPSLRVGAFYQGASGHLRPGCGDTCEGSDINLGLQVSYHVRPRERMDPWVGLGIGYEWTTFATSDFSLRYQGPALQFQAGGDYGLAGPVRMGPFVNLTVGQYSRFDVTEGPHGATEPIQRRAPHFWLAFGLRLQVG